mmetsp:Transcript_50006/g.106372  ORF Transcript_50006/g.106372 Transcript_50006/m.106372 type:complete len:91 (+) Transcript_50006:1216-1488(+)
MNPVNGDEGNPGGQFMNYPPPNHVRWVIQDAMSGVIDRLAQMSAGGSNKQQGGPGAGPNIPTSIDRPKYNRSPFCREPRLLWRPLPPSGV